MKERRERSGSARTGIKGRPMSEFFDLIDGSCKVVMWARRRGTGRTGSESF
jgi:hypothetical protein